MTIVYLAPDPFNDTQFIPGGNTPAAGAQLFCYAQGSSAKQDMYTDVTGTTKWTNPLVLDSGGNLGGSNEIWIPAGLPAKFILAPPLDSDPPVSPYWTRDNISGVNDPTGFQSEWIQFSGTPTFISTTSFSLTGDQTLIFTPGRRIKTTNTSGTIYSTILTSMFGAFTAVVVSNDSGVLDSGLSAVSYGLLNPKNTSLPLIVSVLNFGAKGDSVTDDTAAIQAAVDYCTTIGTTLYFPAGTYLCASTLVFKNNVRYVGAGKSSVGTIISYTGSSDAIQINNPINSSTAANIYIGDMSVVCTTLTAGKAAIADVGSSYLVIERVRVTGNAFGIILDQSELTVIRQCEIDLPASSTAGLWLVNAADHSGGASSFFTNRITIAENQFNGPATGVAVADDGGNVHVYQNNNFNACAKHIRLASTVNVLIAGNEFETCATTSLDFAATRLNGTGATTSTETEMVANFFSSSDAIAFLTFAAASLNDLGLVSNHFNNANVAGTPTSGMTNVLRWNGRNNYQAGTGAATNTALGNFRTGTQTNDSAPTGAIGEILSSTVAAGARIGLTTNTPANITNITLTPGDWDVDGVILFNFNAATSYTILQGSTSITSATIGGEDSKFTYETVATIPGGNADTALNCPTLRFSVNTNTAVYLVVNSVFTVNTCKAYGTIRARRVR